MNQYMGQQIVALRHQKDILIIEETTSTGRCGFSNAAFSCLASSCLYDSAAQGFFIA